MFKICLISFTTLLMSLATGMVSAGSINLPDTQDTFVYSFLSTSTGASLSAFFPGIIAVADDAPHAVNSLVEFGGLGTSGLTAGEISSATLTLTVGSGPGFGPGPSASAPVTVDLAAAASDWDSSVTWNSQPAAAAGFTQIGQVTDSDPSTTTITFNVTSVVESWLSGGLTNNGFILSQDNAGTQSLSFNALSSGSDVPTLTIVTTPEPGTMTLAALALGACGLWRVARRRRAVA